MATDPRQVYELFFAPGEVTEIRAFGLSGKSAAWAGYARPDMGVIGYFDNAEDFGRAAAGLDAAGADGVYFVPNPPAPALLARAKNRLAAAAKKRPATSDHDIVKIRWLLLDFDPVRPAGISSTAVELEHAKQTARAAYEFLRGLGFPEPVKAASGNGYHLDYRIEELENEEAVSKGGGLIQRCLAALQAKCGTEHCKVDQAVYNAARIWKLYGTWARKGDSTEERPHRQSHLFAGGPAAFADVAVTPREVVEKLAAMAPAAPGRSSAKPAAPPAGPPTRKKPARGKTERIGNAGDGLGKLKVEEYLGAYGVEVHEVKHTGGATWYILDHCVFNPEHRAPDAAVVQDDDGRLLYKCFHDSCQGKYWPEVRQTISGAEKLSKYHEGYDPNWRPPDDGRYLGEGLIERLPEIVDTCPEEGCQGVPAPEDVSEMEFFQARGANGRPAFVVRALARYLAAFLNPIVSTDGVFWRYQSGVWRIYPEAKIKKLIILCLRDRVQASWLEETLKVLSGIVSREESEWSPVPHLINVRNGMVDLRFLAQGGGLEEALLPHDPKYDSRCQLPVDFDLDAACNRWVRFLWEIFPEGREKAGGKLCVGDEKIEMAQQFAGYLLMPTCKYERALFMVGAGSNGKSTFLNMMIHVLGPGNTHQMALDQLARTFALPPLQECMLVHCSEMHTRETAAIQVLKQCISGDEITGEHKYKSQVKFRPLCKFAFALNEIPTIVDKSYGFIRKLLIINFSRRFEKEEIDPNLFEKLREEASGIFMWMLEGAVNLERRGGFRESDAVEEEKAEFLQGMNPFLLWVAERCVQGPDLRTPCETLFGDYGVWCERGRLSALGKIKFNQAIAHYLPKVKRVRPWSDGGARQFHYEGIGMRPE